MFYIVLKMLFVRQFYSSEFPENINNKGSIIYTIDYEGRVNTIKLS